MPALVRFARAPVQLPPGGGCPPAAVTAALEASAAAIFDKAASLSAMLQEWAASTWELVATVTPNEWAGGIGSRVGANPVATEQELSLLDAKKSGADDKKKAADDASDDDDEPDTMVRPMSILQCWQWMLRWLWAEKRADMYWCMAALVWVRMPCTLATPVCRSRCRSCAELYLDAVRAGDSE